VGGRTWEESDIELLKRFYPKANRNKVISEINRSWGAIKRMASKFGVKEKHEHEQSKLKQNV